MQILLNCMTLPEVVTKHSVKISLYTDKLTVRFLFLYPCVKPFSKVKKSEVVIQVRDRGIILKKEKIQQAVTPVT